ncbi:MAG TPA: hypothetical protein VFZ25_10250 [Chloroflexota bacterium]|nr:hypothetical protein [Chloroflexota bacterium]
MTAIEAFFNLTTLCPLREAVGALDPTAPPGARLIAGPDLARVRSVGILPGSFNPPTDAHLALAEAALASGCLEVLNYLIATRTVNKEKIEGASLPDRLLCLEAIVDARPNEGVLLVNRGLYVDQAALLREAWPNLAELWFVVGFDKIVQIFDPCYYADIDAALNQLFAKASFLVAPRGADGANELAALLASGRNHRFADQVRLLDLPEQYRELSSSRIRAEIHVRHAGTGVPPIVHAFEAATGAYEPPVETASGRAVDRYAERERLIELGCAGKLGNPSPREFHALWLEATAPDAGAPEDQ